MREGSGSSFGGTAAGGAFPSPIRQKRSRPAGRLRSIPEKRNQQLQAFGHQAAHPGAAHQGAAVFHDVAGTKTVTQGLAHSILHGVGF